MCFAPRLRYLRLSVSDFGHTGLQPDKAEHDHMGDMTAVASRANSNDRDHDIPYDNDALGIGA